MDYRLPNFLITLLVVVLKHSLKISNKAGFSIGPSCPSLEVIKRPDVPAQLLLGLIAPPETPVPARATL